MAELVVEVQLRERNQLTVPAEAAKALDLRPGARLLLRIDRDKRTATIRPLRASYAGVAGTVYGRNAREAAAYVKGERAAWPK